MRILKMLTLGLILLSFLTLPSISTTMAYDKDKSDNRMIIFIVQSDRQRPALERDAVLIANTIQSANDGDAVLAFTTSGSEICSFSVESKGMNPLQVKKSKNLAVNDLQGFFLKLFKPAKGKEMEISDVAGSLSLAMDRFVYTPQSYHRQLIVLLCDGLQRDRSINFKGFYPSDSWIEHKLSPFSAIAANSTKAKVEAVLVPQSSDYTNTYHAQKIRRWYTLLFQRRQAQLIGFTTDHENAAQIIARGGLPPSKPLEALDLYGPLALNQADSLTAEEAKDQ